MPEIDLHRFLEALLSAASLIEPRYFQVPVAGLEAPLYRERVYAYELYHQLRTIWPDALREYNLGGEVDKAGHPIIRGNSLDRAKPDLIAHVPGDMTRNLAVVEIKSGLPEVDAVLTDAAKLAAFCDENRGRYAGGLYLVYGTSQTDVNELLSRCRAVAANSGLDSRRLRIILHLHPGVRPEVHPW